MAGEKDNKMSAAEKAKLHDHFNSSFDATRYASGSMIEVGRRKLHYLDGSDAYANLRKMVISIQHLPSGR